MTYAHVLQQNYKKRNWVFYQPIKLMTVFLLIDRTFSHNNHLKT